MCENDVKGVERTLTVLIVTHVTQVKRVESVVCGSYTNAYIVRSCEPLDVPIRTIQHIMLGCQLTHTLLNLIAGTWPGSDQLRSCTPGVPHAQSARRLV